MTDQITKPKSEEEDEVPVTNQYSVIGKLMSGRFILTVVGAICFFLVVNTVCQMILSKKDVVTVTELTSILSSLLIVISNIFTFYFVRKGMGQEQVNGTAK